MSKTRSCEARASTATSASGPRVAPEESQHVGIPCRSAHNGAVASRRSRLDLRYSTPVRPLQPMRPMKHAREVMTALLALALGCGLSHGKQLPCRFGLRPWWLLLAERSRSVRLSQHRPMRGLGRSMLRVHGVGTCCWSSPWAWMGVRSVRMRG